MTELLSETRSRRAELTRAKAWRAVEALDRAVVDQAVCPACLALRGESCRTYGVRLPEATRIHYERMQNRDAQLRKGFGA
jgi:hypothetical protein